MAVDKRISQELVSFFYHWRNRFISILISERQDPVKQRHIEGEPVAAETDMEAQRRRDGERDSIRGEMDEATTE